MEKIYTYMDEAQCAYLLRKGTLHFDIKEGELYKISGKNLIVGAGEIIMGLDTGAYYYRSYNLYKDNDAELDIVSPENLKKLIFKYSIGFNINTFLAQMIRITNKIMARRQSGLTDDGKAVQDISGAYYKITDSLLELGKKTRFPDIIELSEKMKSELIYETGKIYSQQKSSMQLEVKKEKLDEFSNSYAPNSIICEQGEEGNDMYILNQGRISVLINNNKVAEIEKPGTVIGEIALLLGEKRTATLKAINQVVLTVIKKDNLQEFHDNNKEIFLKIAETLSHRIYNNFEIIRNIDKQVLEEGQTSNKVAGFLTRDRAEAHLKKLKVNLVNLYNKKEYEQLTALIKKSEESIAKYVR